VNQSAPGGGSHFTLVVSGQINKRQLSLTLDAFLRTIGPTSDYVFLPIIPTPDSALIFPSTSFSNRLLFTPFSRSTPPPLPLYPYPHQFFSFQASWTPFSSSSCSSYWYTQLPLQRCLLVNRSSLYARLIRLLSIQGRSRSNYCVTTLKDARSFISAQFFYCKFSYMSSNQVFWKSFASKCIQIFNISFRILETVASFATKM
jgi:hypothetical protein